MSAAFLSNGPLSCQGDHRIEANGHGTADEDVTKISNGISSKNGAKACNAAGIGKEYATVPLNDQPSLKPRKIRAIIIGAGYSGLTLAHKLRYQHPEMEDIVTCKIFEARSDVGGTWLANTYPGVQCDVPAHIYVRLDPWQQTDC